MGKDKIKIKLVRSTIGKTKKQKLTVEALGLRKTNQVVEHKANPAILGMINKIKHLVVITE
ncbi:MAG: 50S ribosomal protein L30 [Spirochaetota bacterium]|nr:50S ribosomal protein L30 [Spirochaetota bacterium]